MLGCVVMAAGEGRRFSASGGAGGPGGKLLADLGGVPLAVRTAASVPCGLFEPVAVTRWPAVAAAIRGSLSGVRTVEPTGPARSDTVRAGLAEGAGSWGACLFLPADQPLVAAASFEALAAAWRADPSRAYRLSRARPRGGVAGGPLPGVSAVPRRRAGVAGALSGSVLPGAAGPCRLRGRSLDPAGGCRRRGARGGARPARALGCGHRLRPRARARRDRRLERADVVRADASAPEGEADALVA